MIEPFRHGRELIDEIAKRTHSRLAGDLVAGAERVPDQVAPAACSRSTSISPST